MDRWPTLLLLAAPAAVLTEALLERLRKPEYTVERLFAGKSESFKHYCQQALHQDILSSLPYPQLPPWEQGDFQRAGEVLATLALATITSAATEGALLDAALAGGT